MLLTEITWKPFLPSHVFIYRLGIDNAQYSISTAVGLMKSVISLVLIALGYKLAEKYGDYRVF